MLARALARYDAILKAQPLRTKTTTALGLAFCTDACLQCYSKTAGRRDGRSDHASTHWLDANRLARQSVWSGVVMAPLLHTWFNWLARIPALGPVLAPVVRVAIDTVTLMPATHVVYFAYTSVLKHNGSTAHVTAEVGEKLYPTLRAGIVVIPSAMLINMSIVPLRFRVLFINLVLGVGYGAFLNVMANEVVMDSPGDSTDAPPLGNSSRLVDGSHGSTSCKTPPPLKVVRRDSAY